MNRTYADQKEMNDSGGVNKKIENTKNQITFYIEIMILYWKENVVDNNQMISYHNKCACQN